VAASNPNLQKTVQNRNRSVFFPWIHDTFNSVGCSLTIWRSGTGVSPVRFNLAPRSRPQSFMFFVIFAFFAAKFRHSGTGVWRPSERLAHILKEIVDFTRLTEISLLNTF
jgi:hypothetical protein